jgi:flagellin
MGMQVNTNIAANNAYRNLATTQNDLSKSLEKLSSGLRINRAADDAAGLTISEGLKSQVGGLTVASRNAQDGISLVQTAEGSLNEAQSILQRMRDLAVQAGNDSNNEESRTAIKTEVTALTKELNRIGDSTNFNGTNLLDGTSGTNGMLSFQVGANADSSSQIKVDLSGANVNAIASTLNSGGVDYAVTEANLTAFGATAQTFVLSNGSGITTNVAVTLTGPQTTKSATVALGGDGNTALQNTVAALNSNSDFANKLVATVAYNTSGVETGIVLDRTDVQKLFVDQSTGTANGTPSGSLGLDFSSATGASAAINMIDNQITAVSTARADLGAVQNRFESVVKTLAVSKENLTAAGSRIRDTDMAEEMVKYTRANILSQAGTAMLAQANQSNSGVLQLLQ